MLKLKASHFDSQYEKIQCLMDAFLTKIRWSISEERPLALVQWQRINSESVIVPVERLIRAQERAKQSEKMQCAISALHKDRLYSIEIFLNVQCLKELDFCRSRPVSSQKVQSIK